MLQVLMQSGSGDLGSRDMGRELQNMRVPGGSDMLTELKARHGTLRSFLDRNPASFSTRPDPFETKAFVISLTPPDDGSGAVQAGGVGFPASTSSTRSALSPRPYARIGGDNTQQYSGAVLNAEGVTDSEAASRDDEVDKEGENEDDQSDGSALVNGKPRSTLQYGKYMGRDAVKDRRKGNPAHTTAPAPAVIRSAQFRILWCGTRHPCWLHCYWKN